MAAERIGRTHEDKVHASDLGASRVHGVCLQKRQARVTVKYNRKELQKRLDVEKWIDDCLDQLYMGREDDMPEEVMIDDLLDLPSDEERVKKLQEILQTCSNDTEAFISELVRRLEGLHKQEELQSEGIEHLHLHEPGPQRHEPGPQRHEPGPQRHEPGPQRHEPGPQRHEPYHFNNPSHYRPTL